MLKTRYSTLQKFIETLGYFKYQYINNPWCLKIILIKNIIEEVPYINFLRNSQKYERNSFHNLFYCLMRDKL